MTVPNEERAVFEDAFTQSPKTSEAWTNALESERLAMIEAFLVQKSTTVDVTVTRAAVDGSVYLTIPASLRASERGVFLRDLESQLKRSVDEGITLWCEPLGDASSLRNLRGIRIVS